MAKAMWQAPTTNVEQFVADQYVAACGEIAGTVYKFKCDAGGGTSGIVYQETNGVNGLQTEGFFTGDWHSGLEWVKADSRLTWITYYHACGETHEAASTDGFLNGYYVPNGPDSATQVVIWRGPNGDNVHCTTNLDMTTWETVKS